MDLQIVVKDCRRLEVGSMQPGRGRTSTPFWPDKTHTIQVVNESAYKGLGNDTATLKPLEGADREAYRSSGGGRRVRNVKRSRTWGLGGAVPVARS